MNEILIILCVFFIAFSVWREWSFNKTLEAERLEREVLINRILELSGIKVPPKVIIEKFGDGLPNPGGLSDEEEAMIEQRRKEIAALKA